jgi:hypothetical protein
MANWESSALGTRPRPGNEGNKDEKTAQKKKESLTERGTWLSILLYLCTWVGWEERYPGGLEDAYTRAKRNIEKDASALTGNHDLAGRLLGKKASGVLVIISWIV